MMKNYTGSQIIIECLKEQGVDTIFGYPGGTILNVYDELYRHQDEIRHILTSHEQGAAHAADGYARATGKVGVCFATSGPGATNLVTGIATAYMDSIPLVAITANVGTSMLGRDSFQEIDIVGVTMPITKYSVIVKDVNDLADTIRRAFVIAKSGRPGPVLVDVTKDATANKAPYEYKEPEKVERSSENIKQESIDKAIELINNAKKPFIMVGGGATLSRAALEVREFVDYVDAPVCDTLMGKGVFDGNDLRYTGMIGMHGTKASNFGVTECDLLIAIGCRFSDRVTGNAKKFAKHAKVIHIDVDAAEVNKNIKSDVSVIGDIKVVLSRINEQMEKLNHQGWLNHVIAMKNQYPLKYDKEKLTGPAVIESLYKATNGDAIITTDVGQHQMWAAQFYKYSREGQLITSGGLGTMGYGVGAAIGAKVGMPDKVVINVAGDGCFRMNMQEIATATRYDIPIVQVVINNHVLGMVRQWQTLFYGKRYSSTILEDKVDFCKTVEGLGGKAFRVTKLEDLDKTIEKAVKLNKPVLVECIIDNDDKVFPMVAPAAPISETFSREDLASKGLSE